MRPNKKMAACLCACLSICLTACGKINAAYRDAEIGNSIEIQPSMTTDERCTYLGSVEVRVDAAPSEDGVILLGEEAFVPNDNKIFTIDMSFAGDAMLATYKGQVKEGKSFSWYALNKEPEYFFDGVREVFESDDFTVVNLENVLTDNQLEEVAKDHSPAYWYKAPTKNKEILLAGSIEAVSFANNHTDDYGVQGAKDTVEAMESICMPYGTEDKTIYLEKNGFVVAIICHGLWGEWQADEIVERIEEASEKSDYQIVFYHGGKEKVHEPEEWKRRASRKLVDAGADLVLGNHPHVLQPMEEYNGANIFYSLGNFCYGGSNKPENRTIICKLLLTVSGGELQWSETSIVPCYVYTGDTNNWQPSVIEDENDKQLVLDFMYGERDLPY